MQVKIETAFSSLKLKLLYIRHKFIKICLKISKFKKTKITIVTVILSVLFQSCAEVCRAKVRGYEGLPEMEKVEAADTPPVLIYHSCASFSPTNFSKCVCLFCAIFGIFACFCTTLRIFCTYFVC